MIGLLPFARRFVRSFLLCGAPVMLAACDAAQNLDQDNLDIEPVSRATLTQVAFDALESIQPRSIKNRREYCGYIILAANGDLMTSSINGGGGDWCVMPAVEDVLMQNPGGEIVADFHTHASYEANEDSEVPSARDMSGNRAANIIGFLGTPGGRFWYIAPDGLSAEQLCATPCLPMDPDYEPFFDDLQIPNFLSYRQVLRRQI